MGSGAIADVAARSEASARCSSAVIRPSRSSAGERAVAGGETIEQEAPAVTRIGHQLLRDRHRPLALGVVVGEASAQPRRVAEGRCAR